MKKLLILLIIFIISSTHFAQNEQLLSIKNNLLVNADVEKLSLPLEQFEKKSPALAILYSLLLPGMGEYYADNYSTGKYFTIADGVFWGLFAGISIYGNGKEDDYRAFASSFGGVDLNGKDDAYFANVGIYENIEDYNRDRELNRRFDEVYNESTHYWGWEDSRRSEYRDLWISSENAKNNVRFAVGALILNRIVSSIFAVRSVSAYNKRENTEVSWNVNFGVQQNPSLPTSFVMKMNCGF
ncbi:MAG: hypothetical protein OQJ81_03150 [Melioribacteraceae bacterium]|nr:hypothetical protein [Melioribacteraceae bacterium]